MNILFTVCGRAGSKGFKNKNLKEMNGVPLVYYTLAAIKGYVEQYPGDKVVVAVNTDSQPLTEVIRRQKALNDILYAERSRELAGNTVPKVEVIKDTLAQAAGSCLYDIVVDLDITSPLRTVEDIRNAVEEYYRNPEYDLVYSAVPARRSPYFNMVEPASDGYCHTVCGRNLTARQQAPKCYEMNASIYVYGPSFLAGSIVKPITQYRTGVSIMKDYLVLDIDSEEDFEMMELLHRYYCERDEGLRKIYETAKVPSFPC